MNLILLSNIISNIREQVNKAREEIESERDDLVEQIDEAGEDDDTNEIAAKEEDYGNALDCLDDIDGQLDEVVSYCGIPIS